MKAKRTYRYLLLDVFTETPLEGNQLAVFPDAHGLSDKEMQALARETRLSETTFCLPGPQAEHSGVNVRIFTTEEELPFAGHPTLGTAIALRWLLPELQGAAEVKLRLKAGVVPVRFRQTPDAPPETFPEAFPSAPVDASLAKQGGLPFGEAVVGEMEQPTPAFGLLHDPLEVAAALGVGRETLSAGKPIQTVSTGLPFVIVVLSDREALGKLDIPQPLAKAYLREKGAQFFYALAQGATATEWEARMQFYGGEDPATGSAAGCATAYLVSYGYAPAATPLILRQGLAMHRPSTLHCSASPGEGNSWGQGSYVRVGGSTVLVAEGRFFLS